MPDKSCQTCIHDCKILKNGSNWHCGAWNDTPKECNYLADNGKCLFRLTATQAAVKCPGLKDCIKNKPIKEKPKKKPWEGIEW